jgi:hypothetical protein
MEIQELKELLEVINSVDEPIGIRVHLVKKDENATEEEILQADVSEVLSEELKTMFTDTINQRFFNDEELILSNISDANELINSAFYYDIDEFPEKLNILQDFDTWQNYSDFSFNNDDIKSIKAILITIGNENNYFTVFKHVYSITILKQDKVLGLFPAENRFEKLTNNILQINNTVDFIYVQDNLIINNLKTLTNAYGYKEVIKNQARERVELIRELDLIDNIDELTAFVDNVKYAKRILKINPQSPVLQLARTRIIDFIRNHEKLSNKIRFNENGDKIMLDTDVSKVITIGILNDDYLKSNLTDLDYESERKEEFRDDE